MVGALLSYYNTLLNIEIPVYMALIALVLVFMQILYGQYSHKEINILFKNKCMLLCIAMLPIVGIVLTLYAAQYLAYFVQEFFYYKFVYYKIFGALILIIFFVPIIIVVILILRQINYLSPSKIALLISKNIRLKDIETFLYKKYGIKNPADSYVTI